MSGYPSDIIVTIAGLSNAYHQYVTTYQEYQQQRYEGASTLYGPNTLAAYLQIFDTLASKLNSSSGSSGSPPKDWTSSLVDLQPGVILDGGDPGTVKTQPNPSYRRGDIVVVVFESAHPRNNLRQQGTYLTVERLIGANWNIVATDGSWETKFEWKRESTILGTSTAKISWDTGNALAGTYRIRHYGAEKNLFGKITEFQGSSRSFQVN